jgi:ribosome-binding protein aMBF1 (putative translation factor)
MGTGGNMKCEICRAESECKFTISVSPAYPSLNVCTQCMNEWGNQEFDKLTKKLKNRVYYEKNAEKARARSQKYYQKYKNKIKHDKKVKDLWKKKQKMQGIKSL